MSWSGASTYRCDCTHSVFLFQKSDTLVCICKLYIPSEISSQHPGRERERDMVGRMFSKLAGPVTGRTVCGEGRGESGN